MGVDQGTTKRVTLSARLQHPAMGLAIAIRKQLEGLHPDDPRSVARATEAILIVDRYCSALQIRFRRLPRLAAAKSFPDPVAALQARLEWALVVGDRHVEFTADDDRVAVRCAIDDDEMDQLLHELSTLPLKYRIDLLREQQRQKSEYNANRDAAKLASGGASGIVVDESLGARGGSGAATHGETTTPAETNRAPSVEQPHFVSAAELTAPATALLIALERARREKPPRALIAREIHEICLQSSGIAYHEFRDEDHVQRVVSGLRKMGIEIRNPRNGTGYSLVSKLEDVVPDIAKVIE